MGFRSDQLLVWFMCILLSPWLSLANNEVDALADFKSKLKDPQGALSSWDTTLVNPCTWFHINCDDPHNPNTVTRIDLGHSGLSGLLSPSLGELKNLRALELYQNNFYGHIPIELGNLPKLETLDLYSNSLTGNIPVQLGYCYHLKFLRLQNNNLCGRPPLEEIAMIWFYGPRHGNPDIQIQLYPGNPNLCNPMKDKFCVPGCCKKCK